MYLRLATALASWYDTKFYEEVAISMKKKARIFLRIYIMAYLILLLETRGFYISETENAGLLVFLPVIIPWCFTKREKIIEKWTSEKFQDVILRIFGLAVIVILLERQVEFFCENYIISVLSALMVTVIAYFAKIKKDLILLNCNPYIKYFWIFAAEIFVLYLTKISISVEITPESFSNITFPEILKALAAIVVLLPLILFLNCVRKDQGLQPAKRVLGGFLFFFFVLININLLVFALVGIIGSF